MASPQISILARRSGAVPTPARTTTTAQKILKKNNPSTTKLHDGSNNNNKKGNNRNTTNPSFSYMKHGIGRLTASSSSSSSTKTTKTTKTKLTQVSHKAPMRWIPLLQNSRIEKAGSAVAAMSNYGAGLLPGDVNQVQINVESNAKLGILTQGSNRIYKSKNSSSSNNSSIAAAKSTLEAKVDKYGLLVVAPDPTVPFENSIFHQQQEFCIHPTSSLITVDWFSAGRYANGERWLAKQICSETKLRFTTTTTTTTSTSSPSSLVVWDSTTLELVDENNNNNTSSTMKMMNPFGFDLGQQSFNAYASMLLYGTESKSVVKRLRELQYQLAAPYTRLRQQQQSVVGSQHHDDDDDDVNVDDDDGLLLGTTGRVLLGVNQLQVATTPSPTQQPLYMARFCATSNEDLYRILHYSLKPLSPLFGLEFYQDRIRATSSGRRPQPPTTTTTTNSSSGGPILSQQQQQQDKAVVDSSVPSIEIPKQQQQQEESAAIQQTSNAAAVSWKAYMLADSALPTGSFAHSAGLEAASQLGLLNGDDDSNNNNKTNHTTSQQQQQVNEQNVQAFIEASTRSALQQATPWILSGHKIMVSAAANQQPSSSSSASSIAPLMVVEEWEKLDQQVHAVMVCSAPACRASIDQGRNLLRVAIPWLQQQQQQQQQQRGGGDEETSSSASHNSNAAAAAVTAFEAIEECIKNNNNNDNNNINVGHMAPLFGMFTGALGLTAEDACNLLGYCVARDIVSAAVRLNLIGPLKSVAMLSKAQSAAQAGIHIGLSSSSSSGSSRTRRNSTTTCPHEEEREEEEDDEKSKNLLWPKTMAGGCSPVIDAIHPCHDILAVRLFRT